MARTVEQIFNSMIDYKAQQSELNGLTNAGLTNYQSTIQALNNGSKVSVWRRLILAVASAAMVLEQLWDEFKLEVDEKIRLGIAGTLGWYVYISKNFQLGDALTIDNDFIPKYAVIESSKQIVKFVSAKEQSGNVVLKVAKLVANAKTPLSDSELTQFVAYIDRMKPAGVSTICRSLPADILTGHIEVYFDPIFASISVQTSVQTAIQSYLNQLDFDGFIFVEKLTDAIQAVPGVKDVAIRNLEGRNASIGSVIQFFNISSGINARFYECQSGYINVAFGNSPTTTTELFIEMLNA